MDKNTTKMDKNTYEAIKTIVITVKLDNKNREILRVTIKQVEDWIDEVGKEYEGICPICEKQTDELGRCKCCNKDSGF